MLSLLICFDISICTVCLGNYCEGPEVQTLEMLLQAFDEEDAEAAKKALSNPFIKHMDVEYAILARDLPLPEGLTAAPKASVRENAAPSYVSPNLQATASFEVGVLIVL